MSYKKRMRCHFIIAVIMALFMAGSACVSSVGGNGWYRLAESNDNITVGEPLIKVKDFQDIVLIDDTIVIENDSVRQFLIQGRVKADKRGEWADETERLIGHRIGFVFDDSVICSPQINARIESGSFEITSSDTVLIRKAYNVLKQEINQMFD